MMSIDLYFVISLIVLFIIFNFKTMQQKKADLTQQLTAADKFIPTSGAGATHSIWEESIARRQEHPSS